MPERDHHVGPPRLLDFTCNVKEPGSGTASCHLVFKLEDETTYASSSGPNETSVNLELKPATLATLVDSLGRIRDQLSSVTNKK